jgi:3-isopropylmalate/(R)-2-methylmalate dehydratase small subunit
MQAERKTRAWVFGDNIDTDLLAPGRFMSRPIEELSQNCLIDLSPDFAANAGCGDVLIAGRNFGVGSSREQAAQALKVRGLTGVVAQSFAGIFYRNAINLGLPVLVGNAQNILDGEWVSLDVENGDLKHEGGCIKLEKIPDFLMSMIRDGGLVAHLENRFAKEGKVQ